MFLGFPAYRRVGVPTSFLSTVKEKRASLGLKEKTPPFVCGNSAWVNYEGDPAAVYAFECWLRELLRPLAAGIEAEIAQLPRWRQALVRMNPVRWWPVVL